MTPAEIMLAELDAQESYIRKEILAKELELAELGGQAIAIRHLRARIKNGLLKFEVTS